MSTTRLSSVMTGWGLKLTTCSRRSDQRAHPVDVRDHEVQAGIQGAAVAAQALDVGGTRLGDDPHRF